MEPDAYGVLSSHFAQGCPSPLGHIRTCEAIALRNARELAEQQGYFDHGSEATWPRDDIFEYGPSNFWLEGGDVYADRLTGKWAPADIGKRCVFGESDDEDSDDHQLPGGGPHERATRMTTEGTSPDADDLEDFIIDLDQAPSNQDIKEDVVEQQLVNISLGWLS